VADDLRTLVPAEKHLVFTMYTRHGREVVKALTINAEAIDRAVSLPNL
jgi:hypothetical protein